MQSRPRASARALPAKGGGSSVTLRGAAKSGSTQRSRSPPSRALCDQAKARPAGVEWAAVVTTAALGVPSAWRITCSRRASVSLISSTPAVA